MKNRKYPLRLFITGFISDIFFHFFWLFIPSVILLIIGKFVKPCLYIGLAILLLDVILSLIERIRIRSAFIKESSNPVFNQFVEAMSMDGDLTENLDKFFKKNTKFF